MSDPTAQDHLERARQARDRGEHSAASFYYRLYLELSPADAAVRREYRETQRKSCRQSAAAMVKKSSRITGLFLTSDPQEVLKKGEELLGRNPYDVNVLFRMGKAAAQARFFDLALDIFEDLLPLIGEKPFLLRELAMACYGAEQFAKALATFTRYDTSGEAEEIRQIIKGLEAQAFTQQFARKSQTNDIREIEATSGQSARLAKGDERPKTPEDRQRRIQELEAASADERQAGPRRLAAAVEMARLYEEARQFDQAIAVRERAKVHESGSGYESDKAITELTLKKMEHELSRAEATARDNPTPDLQDQVRQLRLARWQTAADRYGELLLRQDESEIRFELGKALLRLAQLHQSADLAAKAISQFQSGFASQRHTEESSLLLGECFAELKLYDLAEKQFQELAHNPAMSKDVVLRAYYGLGMVQKTMGKLQDAFASFGEVFRRDVTYRDVAELVLEMNRQVAGGERTP